uniref:Uncharacterized protein n=1 Tax=Oryza meridionalis TaxID=40149 RepID=A0A0E0EPD0_9ORYZ
MCALLVTDRGNRLIRQINLKQEDCARETQPCLGTTSVSIIAVLCALLGSVIGFSVRHFYPAHEVSINHFFRRMQMQYKTIQTMAALISFSDIRSIAANSTFLVASPPRRRAPYHNTQRPADLTPLAAVRPPPIPLPEALPSLGRCRCPPRRAAPRRHRSLLPGRKKQHFCDAGCSDLPCVTPPIRDILCPYLLFPIDTQCSTQSKGMASMDDVDFSPHQATAMESMNSEDDAKVQPSSGQTTNKGNYYMGHTNAIMMMFQFIRDGCWRVESSMEDYKCKKVEEGRGEKRKHAP